MNVHGKDGDGNGAGRGEAPSRPEKPVVAEDRETPAESAQDSHRAAVDQSWLIEAISDGVALIDMNGRFVAVNRTLEELLGEPRGDLVGASAIERIGKTVKGTFADEALAIWKEIASGGSGTWTYNLVFTDKQGEEIPISCKVSLAQDTTGAPPLVVVVVRDLTELQEFRAALSSSEERYRTLFDHSLELVFEHDLSEEGRFVDLNDRALELLGYSRDEISSLAVSDVIAPEDMPRARRNMKNLLETGRDSGTHEYCLTGKGGRRVWVEVAGSLVMREDKPRALLGVGRDITDRKNAEEAFKTSEERFRELVELLPEIVYEVDATGRITFVNRRAFELTGYTREDLEKGMFATELFAPGERERLVESIGRLLEGARPRKNEYLALKKDGTTFPVVANSVPIMRDGKAIGVRGIAFDLSEQRQMEQTLLQTQKIETIGTLAGGIAHDINNVLASISSLATLIKEETAPGDPRSQDIEDILAMTARGGDFARNLLGFARQGKYRKERVSLNKMAGQVLKIAERTVSKKVAVKTDLDPGLDDVEGDPGQLTQVLMNLCLNAVEAVQDEGTVTISTSGTRFEELSGSIASGLSPGRYVKLEVRDDGTGMDEETRTRAFEPFYTTKEPGKGTGLGLAMVFGVVKNHQGDVFIESEKGKGTTVTALLPALEAKATETRDTKSPLPTRQQGTGTVLLVDDEELLRSTGKRLLAKLGYRVLLAGDGSEALEIFRQHGNEIDLILLDLGMPVMDGAECFRKLKELSPEVRVLIASGYSDADKVEGLLADGALGFLHKPFSAEHLSRAISRGLGVLPADRPDGR